MKVVIVGATGMVGKIMLQVLEERKFPVSKLIPVASENSVGKTVVFNGKNIQVVTVQDALNQKPDLALFSAGGNTSIEWAPKFAKQGTYVVDNSSAWRMDETKKLIVPEINSNVLEKSDKLIANPNCSTIQLVLVLNPLHSKYKIKRVVISTYQSVTGTGKAAVDQLENEILGNTSSPKVYPHPIFKNALPHCDVFSTDDYTKEELKLMNEPKKILNDYSLNICATAVRVPVQGGHSESVNIEFENEFDLDDIKMLLSSSPGIILQDDVKNNIYPMPVYAEGKDEVFVGRIRKDPSQPNTINLWIVSDNLRKGAATNAIQIAEYLNNKNFIN